MDTNSTYLAVIILAILYSFLLLFAILRYQQHFHGAELIIYCHYRSTKTFKEVWYIKIFYGTLCAQVTLNATLYWCTYFFVKENEEGERK